ncbi:MULTISPECIES: malto-oligosyltrehalose synthase [unclassified Rhodococcus (in: high G+C Gram-positive bacteria)]|uniref:malto-oligosyltrehalose synthase n=1 Tax=unclassified Rhodococcus (in: high G+C Gram-positive bacteria) TaxID=192944 RepID=UPI00163B56DF|nr:MULTISPECIES: malto-oligosyltrehalose synthase [unclassified Rhodococcus (in: high G+C Gram-positive bacteria)]MBC2638515.1 malto-oligosyltrehalose synthase [Rhodococcus sp. 3A]MBC2896744.1 malto-oligosyltrehalose synthase [Rhodococcus sp. 4CII]
MSITATYRVQLRGDCFTLAEAAAVAGYLDDLGISHVYLSPILTATTGSTHGYDVTDVTRVSPALGGREALVALSRAVRERGMGIVVDLVPNHVGVAQPRENAWWWDVLTHGRRSEYADFFDIDWSADNGADARLALPVLGSGADLASLTVDRSGPEPLLAFYEHRFPIAPGTDAAEPVAVHDAQSYRLVPWDSGLIGYRRFFAVSELAGIRQEDPRVFEASHRELRSWVADGLIDGVRIDHPDGLSDPAEYLDRLRNVIGADRWLVVEKILGHSEPLDDHLPIEGTTGYDALAELGGVFVDPSGAPALTALSASRTGERGDAAWIHAHETAIKKDVARTILAPEVRRLVRAIRAETGTDCDSEDVRDAVVDVVAAMPVYRSDYSPLAGLAARVIGDAARREPQRSDALSALGAALIAGGEAATRFQQVCGAVMAKSVEDCLFYRTARLVSLQEVGGNPANVGVSPAEFHLAAAERASRWPRAMTTLSTHDTKRGEDVRARIGILSQVPDLWAECVDQWERIAPSPDPATGLFLWQNLFGVWPVDGRAAADVPDFRDRIHAYAEKAVREAGTRTSWNAVNDDFERDLHRWLDTVIDGTVGKALGSLCAQLAPHAWSDALGQKLLQLCGPGIPDVYQGTELWEDSLVDPDNRRPVDYDVRRDLLAGLDTPPVDATGAAKMHVVRTALRLRRDRPDSFAGGTYAPIFASGAAAEHLIGFLRGRADAAPDVVALATRHSVDVEQCGWGDTTVTLPAGTWTDLLTSRAYPGGPVDVAALFSRYPVALLAL